MKKGKRILSIIWKTVILIAVIYGVIMSTEDQYTLTKFTTLSNVGIGIAMLLFIIVEAKGIKSGSDGRKQWMFIFKFMMTIGVVITFAMYATMIGPSNPGGLIGAYGNHHYGSMMLHLVSPVMSVIDFFIFDDRYVPKLKHAIFSLIPPVAYVGMIYVLAQGGYRWAHGMSAPYAFINFGAPVGWWGFDLSTACKTSTGIGVGYMTIGLIIIFILIGMIMLAIKKKTVKK